MQVYRVSQMIGVRNDLLRALKELDKVVDNKTTVQEAAPKVRRQLDAAIRKSYRMEEE
jgi:hypothetical protein